MVLDSKIPEGPLAEKWTKHKFNLKLVNPANKRKYDIIVVGTGLAGASAAASFGELGYNVKAFCYQDSPRRAHSIAAQGGINAAKNYTNEGDSIWRLFYDTIKGGDFRAREANVYRLAQLSNDIIDHCVAQGIPFARDYGGLLANRSFGGAQVSRTFYARGQTGQQLLLGAYSALSRQIAAGKVQMFSRREMLDLVVVNGQARGIVVRNLINGDIERHDAQAVVLCTGGYGNVYRAHDPALQRDVALKLLHEFSGGSAGDVESFLTEARRLARVRHPNVLVVHGADRHEGRTGLPADPVTEQALVERFVEEEILYREALLRGLATDNPAVIGRLRQKLEFLGDEHGSELGDEAVLRQAAELGLADEDLVLRNMFVRNMRLLLAREGDRQPSVEEVEAFFRRRASEFRRPARVSWRHVFVDRDGIASRALGY